MKLFLLALSFCFVASSVSAQPITSWTLKSFNVGAGSPLQSATLLVANVTCNQTPPAPGSPVNPTKVSWDDVANAGKVCVWTDPGTGPLTSVPFGGSYEAAMSATNSAGTSADSARVPFTRPGLAPGAPTGLKLAS